MTDEACICYLENISKLFEQGKENCTGDALELQQKHIDALQYAIKELRKNERSQGEWIDSYPEIEKNPMFNYGICSRCKFEQSMSNKLNFCPNCGADMRGGTE